ncbi:MAG: PIN domain-containing protein, partial [Spirochaetales bacterium]|nr:PIN domain-containing protein [Spirochaetales bacterium]
KIPDSRKKNDLLLWFDRIQDAFRYQTLEITEETALKWGELSASSLKKGRTLHSIDGIIAATAYTSGSILVTRNTRDFDFLPIQILNPWL